MVKRAIQDSTRWWWKGRWSGERMKGASEGWVGRSVLFEFSIFLIFSSKIDPNRDLAWKKKLNKLISVEWPRLSLQGGEAPQGPSLTKFLVRNSWWKFVKKSSKNAHYRDKSIGVTFNVQTRRNQKLSSKNSFSWCDLNFWNPYFWW